MGIPKIDWAKLSDAERLQLLDDAWESFRAAPDTLPLTLSQAEEIDRRQVAYKKGTMKARSWEVVRKEIREQLRYRP